MAAKELLLVALLGLTGCGATTTPYPSCPDQPILPVPAYCTPTPEVAHVGQPAAAPLPPVAPIRHGR